GEAARAGDVLGEREEAVVGIGQVGRGRDRARGEAAAAVGRRRVLARAAGGERAGEKQRRQGDALHELPCILDRCGDAAIRPRVVVADSDELAYSASTNMKIASSIVVRFSFIAVCVAPTLISCSSGS